mmetsp:Transcript_10984/g.25062  ORF Transcript_10984/g.25062 Transcript_10984/m.25062 type:complete len:730 (+) Transcript_10984:34-2223(+)
MSITGKAANRQPSHAARSCSNGVADKHAGSLMRSWTGRETLSQLADVVKEHDSLCGYLSAVSRQSEEQIQKIQEEQQAIRRALEALCRCVGQGGALSADLLRKELEASSALSPRGDGVSLSSQLCAALATGAGAGRQAATVFPGAKSRVPNGSERTLLMSARTDKSAASTSCAARVRSHSPQFLQARSASTSSLLSAKTTGASVASGIPRKVGTRSDSRSVLREGAAGMNTVQSGKSQLSVTGRAEIENQPPAGDGADLYSLAKPLLGRGLTAEAQQRALKAIQQHLKKSSEPPSSWRGPGTPLGVAVQAGRADLTRILLRARADVNIRDEKGVSPLHSAVFEGSMELIKVLLGAHADVNACDRHGQTPLFFAPTREICKLLLEHKPDINMLNRRGQSALHLAGRGGLLEVLTWLSSKVDKELLELRDVHGITALEYAQQAQGASSGQADIEVPVSTSQSARASNSRAAAGGERRGASRSTTPPATRSITPPARATSRPRDGACRSSSPSLRRKPQAVTARNAAPNKPARNAQEPGKPGATCRPQSVDPDAGPVRTPPARTPPALARQSSGKLAGCSVSPPPNASSTAPKPGSRTVGLTPGSSAKRYSLVGSLSSSEDLDDEDCEDRAQRTRRSIEDMYDFEQGLVELEQRLQHSEDESTAAMSSVAGAVASACAESTPPKEDVHKEVLQAAAAVAAAAVATAGALGANSAVQDVNAAGEVVWDDEETF